MDPSSLGHHGFCNTIDGSTSDLQQILLHGTVNEFVAEVFIGSGSGKPFEIDKNRVLDNLITQSMGNTTKNRDRFI